MKEQMYLISEDKLIELLTAQHELNCLVEAGVDNWGWYMINRKDYIMTALYCHHLYLFTVLKYVEMCYT